LNEREKEKENNFMRGTKRNRSDFFVKSKDVEARK